MTYTYLDTSSGAVVRGLTLEAAGRERASNSEGHYIVGLSDGGETMDFEADGEGFYYLCDESDNARYHGRGGKTVLMAYADRRAEAEKQIFEEFARIEGWRGVRGEVITDAEMDAWIADAQADEDTHALRAYGRDDLAAEIEAAHPEIVERERAAHAAAVLIERRPVVWAEHNPEGLQAHMARRPKGCSRASWAETMTDTSLDYLLTVTEQLRQLDRTTRDAHMARRPFGTPRGEWAQRLVTEPAGGYNAYQRLVINSRMKEG